ncbi:MAG: phosphoribosylformylglycinamidine cyclo-ligase [Gemmatimonadota bacterium]
MSFSPVDRSGLTYREAGVDLKAAADLKERLAELVASTRTEAVRAGYGSFGGRFTTPSGDELVASADGVGTKLKVAQMAGRHDSVGEDLVNHCVNDVLADGGSPLVFLDYFACGALEPEVAFEVVSGVARGCRRNGCALVGGETAEMPGFYAPGEYDLAGFLVGRIAYPEVARRELRQGDRLVALASNGLHTNGFTLVRRIVLDRLGLDLQDEWPGSGRSVADELLRVHRSYLAPLREPCEAGWIRALAHITGGGIPGNLVRVLPPELDAVVWADAWEPGEPYGLLAGPGGTPREEMFRVFNMGVGMIAVVHEEEASVVAAAEAERCAAWPCGELVPGGGRVRLEGVEG